MFKTTLGKNPYKFKTTKSTLEYKKTFHINYKKYSLIRSQLLQRFI